MDDGIPCTCSYKCQHFLPGVHLVPRSTWYYHDKLSSQGKVHHSVTRLIPRQDEATSSGATNAEVRNERVLLPCFCRLCTGTRKWTQATIDRHYSLERMRNILMAIPTSSQERRITVVNHELGMSSSEPVAPTTAMILQAPEALSLQDAIMTQIIDLQVLLDKSHMSIENQGQIMQEIFGTFQKQPSWTNSGAKDYRDLSLGRLLSLAGPNWNGDLGGIHAPTSWEQLTKIYKGLGMLEAQKWRLCTGDKEASHAPVLMKPHKEDCSDLKLKCLCVPSTPVKHRRDCRGCCEKCPTCLKMRKDVFSFEYLSVIGLLTSVCLSRSLCHENLALWRNRDAWKDLPSDFEPATIKEFWDGSKFKEYASFWDPQMEWEVPIVCPNPTCKRTFRAFPESQKCEELRTSWKNDRDLYSFPCSLCSTLVEAPKLEKKVRL